MTNNCNRCDVLVKVSLPANRYLVAIGVILHQPQSKAADDMTNMHEAPEDPSTEPYKEAGNVENDTDPTVPVLSFLQLHVLRVPLINDSCKPFIHTANNANEEHAQALRKVTELMGKDSAKGAHVHSRYQW